MGKTEKTLYSAGTASSRGAVIRVLPGFDIVEGIEEACRHLGIACGAVVSCVGSLQGASISYVISSDSNIVGAALCEPKVLPSPLELISAQGTIGLDENGETIVHLHGTVCDTEGNMYGGHFARGKNRVLVTCETVLTEISGARVVKVYDSKVEFSLFLSTEEKNM